MKNSKIKMALIKSINLSQCQLEIAQFDQYDRAINLKAFNQNYNTQKKQNSYVNILIPETIELGKKNYSI